MSRAARAGAAAIALALWARAASAAPPPAASAEGAAHPRWEYVVRAADLARGELEIELALHGFHGPLGLCADMARGGSCVRDLRLVSDPAGGARDGAAAAGLPLVPDPDDADCWQASAPDSGPLRVRYRYDLAALARKTGDPDWATRAGDSYVFNEEAVLLRPDPLPDDGAIEVSFELPPGASVTAPWRRLPGAPWRFASDARQYDAGSYVALGKLKVLEEIPALGGSFGVTLLDEPRRAPNAVLHAWVAKAGRAVARFYRGVPGGRVHVVLVPVPRATEPDVFGTVLRRAAPSVVMFLGGAADPGSFAGDWMATHELFHVGNPRLDRKVRWLNEGSATYYQDVLRGRAGMVAEERIWGDLYDGFRRFCDPDGGHSLRESSENLGRWHRYVQVYWSGACLFFRADAAIRERSGGKRSLDDVLRELRGRGLSRALSEDEAVAAIDEAAGAPIARTHLEAREPIPLDALYRKLGIEPTGKDTVRLHDEAPLAWVRKAILAPDP